MRKFTTILFVGVLAVLLVTSATRADETKVPLDQLPKAVADAVKAKFPGAELQNAVKEDADGQTVFEVSLKLKAQQYDVSVTPEGKIVEIETEIAAKDLPAAVSKTLDQKYAKANI